MRDWIIFFLVIGCLQCCDRQEKADTKVKQLQHDWEISIKMHNAKIQDLERQVDSLIIHQNEN